MNCRKIRINLPAYLYGELNKDEREAVDRHVLSCGKCQRTLAEIRHTMQALDQWPDQPAGDRIFTGIAGKIAPEILLPEELAAYLRVTLADIMANISSIPHVKIGELVRFHRDTVIQWITGSGGIKESVPADELSDWKYLVNRAQNN